MQEKIFTPDEEVFKDEIVFKEYSDQNLFFVEQGKIQIYEGRTKTLINEIMGYYNL